MRYKKGQVVWIKHLHTNAILGNPVDVQHDVAGEERKKTRKYQIRVTGKARPMMIVHHERRRGKGMLHLMYMSGQDTPMWGYGKRMEVRPGSYLYPFKTYSYQLKMLVNDKRNIPDVDPFFLKEALDTLCDRDQDKVSYCAARQLKNLTKPSIYNNRQRPSAL